MTDIGPGEPATPHCRYTLLPKSYQSNPNPFDDRRQVLVSDGDAVFNG